eukprot:Skav234434  [mRNA]  locus=scaffold3409:49312:57556:+ [translate_table: standard]
MVSGIGAAVPSQKAADRASGRLYQSVLDFANAARTKFYTFLRTHQIALPRQREALDGLLCDYLEFLWSSGEGRGLASDTVAGLQDHDPRLRGSLVGSWRLLKAWSMHEIPSRAPPFPESVLLSMVGWAIFKEQHGFALSFLLAFYGLLRTGELYDIVASSVAMSSAKSIALVHLDSPKEESALAQPKV